MNVIGSLMITDDERRGVALRRIGENDQDRDEEIMRFIERRGEVDHDMYDDETLWKGHRST